jgi:hypothetical protein
MHDLKRCKSVRQYDSKPWQTPEKSGTCHTARIALDYNDGQKQIRAVEASAVQEKFERHSTELTLDLS